MLLHLSPAPWLATLQPKAFMCFSQQISVLTHRYLVVLQFSPPTHPTHPETYPFYKAGFSKYFVVPQNDVSTFGTNSHSTWVCWMPLQACHSPVKGTCCSEEAV